MVCLRGSYGFKGNEGDEKYKKEQQNGKAFDSNTMDDNEQLEEETDESIDAGITYTIPKRYKEKAKQLMQRLRACSKVV